METVYDARYWWAGKYKPYYLPYASDIPYEDNSPKRKSEIWNPLRPHICPHCRGNNARLQREANHLYCIVCGWRESEFFNPRLKKFVRWIERLEKKNGTPMLISDKEKEGYIHKVDLPTDKTERERVLHLANVKRDYQRNNDRVKAYRETYYADDEHRKARKEYMKRYNETHKKQVIPTAIGLQE